jgi:hypothetical protein
MLNAPTLHVTAVRGLLLLISEVTKVTETRTAGYDNSMYEWMKTEDLVYRQILLDPAELPLHRISTLVRDQRLRVGEEGLNYY